MGNIHSSRWGSFYTRKDFVEFYVRRPGKRCECGRRVKWLLSRHDRPDVVKCRVCFGLCYMSQNPRTLDNESKRQIELFRWLEEQANKRWAKATGELSAPLMETSD
ncbi:hypothetical protein IAD21_01215 [Abditibacteriota bacterium]|nr:hypothetical protein IAD21_01215 [Abditibacteriota bacterium]